MEEKKQQDEQSSVGVAALNKRPYEAPRVLSDEPLEVAATLCPGDMLGSHGKPGNLNCTAGFGS